MNLNVALIGNPNTGKSTLFNRLSGAKQQLGNWPGVTVEKKSGLAVIGSKAVEIVDLPGIYSLYPEASKVSLDEQVTVNFLQHQGSILVNVIDATNLQRHLLLTYQLLALEQPLIVVLNMLDIANEQGIEIDVNAMREQLKVPVVEICASRNEGIPQLLYNLELELLNSQVKPFTNSAQRVYEFGEIEFNNLDAKDFNHRFEWATKVAREVVTQKQSIRTLTQQLDQFVLNKWLGIPIFLLIMYLLFFFAINIGSVFIDFFDILSGDILVTGMAQLLNYWQLPQWLIVILAEGVGGGIQLIATFIPVIGCLYLFLSILEDSGYMARAAFVVDRLMKSIGLPGSAFVPLIVGFGCNVPSVMASRSLSREQDRLLTIAMSPFMSCGARLTVYALFGSVFFSDWASSVVFLLYLFGVLVAIFTGWVFKHYIFSNTAPTSYSEMPLYHRPLLGNILTVTWHRLSSFIKRAGKTIILMVCLLSVLNSIDINGQYRGPQSSQDSWLSYSAKQLTPLLTPMGITSQNWPATVGLFTGVFAKEAIVGSLDNLYSNLQENENLVSKAIEAPLKQEFSLFQTLANALLSIVDNSRALVNDLVDPLGLRVVDTGPTHSVEQTNLAAAMKPLFGSSYSAFCYLVFILLYTPCIAVIGAMKRESGSLWALVVVSWSSFLAYWCASVLYQIAQLSIHNSFALYWLLAAGPAMYFAIKGLSYSVRFTAKPTDNLIAIQR